MIVDCHVHFTTEPKALLDFRERQIAALKDSAKPPDPKAVEITDDDLRACIEPAQLKVQSERGIDLTLLSPRASGMGHHIGDFDTSLAWSRLCNDLIARVSRIFPGRFAGVCQLPQSPGVPPERCIDEIERCVHELGIVGFNLNPDPSGGYFNSPPLTDKWWYPIYEKLVELDVPAMVHVSASCNPALHFSGSYYINADTMGFVQLILSDLFEKFPKLRLIIPHGGGAAPFHWGRYRGIALQSGKPELSEIVAQNIFFDTCVYHQAGIDLLTQIVPTDNILFASELIGAVKGVDPATGYYFDDTRRYVEAAPITDAQRRKIFEQNSRRVYPRLGAKP
ncbi:MAG: amidohydrolase family protein [Vulcanimicrobiaceae bacterium]